MAEQKVGLAVVAQAQDNSIWNTEPAVARGAVIALVSAVGGVLVVTGILDNEQKEALSQNAGTIAFAALTIVPILQAVWTRFGAWSGRSVAKIALENAVRPSGVATLEPPP
jgi:hypothetical protein